nr:FKBP-type peptidylprolyl isomerase [uncultured Flavobacterium sp.]
MNNFFKAIVCFTLALLVVSCSKSDDSTEPLRDYAEQYQKDIVLIEEFLQTHYITVTQNPGSPDDQNVTFTRIPAGGTQTSIWNSPDLVTNYTVEYDDITYKLYYLKLRQGSGANSQSPCNVDRVLTSYVGQYLYTTSETVGDQTIETIELKEFERNLNPQSFFTLSSTIRAWGEVFPKFSTGSYSENPDGTLTFSDFGAGIMFIPSGLAYFGSSSGTIPRYSNLIFTFKLYEIQRVDNDGDGVYSYQEDLNGDGYVKVLGEGVTNVDDTDGDEVPDFLDVDDDGDFFMTKNEIKNPLTGLAYPFDQIPLCAADSNKKVHVSAACHP